MTAATLNLTGNFIIEQGAYWQLQIVHPGDLSNAYLKGQIRRIYGGEVLADFRFDAPDYDAGSNETLFTIYLNASQTLKFPAPDEDDNWRYDILLFDGRNDPVRLLQGSVELSLGVTR